MIDVNIDVSPSNAARCSFVMLFWFSLIPSFAQAFHLHRHIRKVATQMPAPSVLDLTITTTPIQTLAAANGTAHLSTVHCHREKIQEASC